MSIQREQRSQTKLQVPCSFLTHLEVNRSKESPSLLDKLSFYTRLKFRA